MNGRVRLHRKAGIGRGRFEDLTSWKSDSFGCYISAARRTPLPQSIEDGLFVVLINECVKTLCEEVKAQTKGHYLSHTHRHTHTW